MDSKKLSIIVYSNGGYKYTLKAIDSLNASKSSLEIILICDEAEFLKIKSEKSLDNTIIKHVLNENDCRSLLYKKAVDIANGQYISFMKNVDEWECSAIHRFLEFTNENDAEVITSTKININSSYSVQNKLKDTGIAKYDCSKLNKLPIDINGCFFSKNIIKDKDVFGRIDDESIYVYAIANIIDENVEIYKINNLIYLNSNKDKINYINVSSNQFLMDIIDSKLQYNEIKQFYMIVELKKYLNNINSSESIDDNYFENRDEINSFVKKLFKYISYDVIGKISSLADPYRVLFSQIKNDIISYECFRIDNGIVKCGDVKLFKYINKIQIKILEIRNNILRIEGLDYLNLIGEDWKLVIEDNIENTYIAKNTIWPLIDKKDFTGKIIYNGRRFIFEIPMVKGMKNISFYAVNGDEKILLSPDQYGVYSKFAKNVPNLYYVKNSFIIKRKSKKILIQKNRKKNRIKSELRMVKFLFQKKYFDIILIRLIYFCISIFKNKPIWIIRDNEDRAKDSGAEMFKFYSKWKYNNIAKVYFVLDKKSNDYKKLKAFGSIIQPDSFKYRLYHLLADKLIDTRGGINSKYIFGNKEIYFRDLCDWDYIWLIHGIMTRNESTWTNKFALNAKLFATCNEKEYESVIDPKNGYGYNKNIVKLTGLPRHDSLKANKKKKILFLPTWRKHLAGDLKPGSSTRAYVKDFKENDYYKFYNSLINDKRLLSLMKTYGYTGDFYLHPSFIKQSDDFKGNEVISIGKKAADTNKLIGESSLLITDYSSAQFEGAYLDIPIIYAQYDQDNFSELHTGKEGYFVYENDGFGPVCKTVEETVDEIVSYIKNDCKNVEPYKSRAKNFFHYHDSNNCERVFNEILKIDNKDPDRYWIDQRDEYSYLYNKDQILKVVENNKINNLYYYEWNIEAQLKNIKTIKDGFYIISNLFIKDSIGFDENSEIYLEIGELRFPVNYMRFKKIKKGIKIEFSVELNLETLVFNKKSTSIYVILVRDGIEKRINLKYKINKLFLRRPDKVRLYFSPICIVKDGTTTAFIRSTKAGNLYIVMRDRSITDSKKEQRKINRAYYISKLLINNKYKKSIVLFEKFATKYEESASVLYEKLIDEGYKNIFFIMDKDSQYYNSVGEKYKKNIIAKYSYVHYLLFFSSNIYMSTESMSHAVELNIGNKYVSKKILSKEYDYIFLQHGVMYMYSLENRNDFIRGRGFTKSAKVVVSSDLEAQHLIDFGEFNREDLILSGLPKFDRAVCDDDANKILIMPTSRDFEYNIMRLNPEQSSYYKFVKNIILNVPDELKKDIVFVAHPLIKAQMYVTDLSKYMPPEFTYDKLLKKTRVLITDYSSISYDAFYRGVNVIFCWEDKEMCLNAMNYKLMLSEDTAFGDISKNFNDLPELIYYNYYNKQKKEYLNKYRKIVEFYDNRNTDRCFEYLKENDFLSKRSKINIKNVIIKGYFKKVYSGGHRVHTNMELQYNNRVLVYNRDYKFYYINNKKIGKNAILIILGKGEYYGIMIKRFRISKNINATQVFGLRWDNDNQCIDDTSMYILDNDKCLIKNKDYYINGIELFKEFDCVRVTIQGIGNYGNKKNIYLKMH